MKMFLRVKGKILAIMLLVIITLVGVTYSLVSNVTKSAVKVYEAKDSKSSLIEANSKTIAQNPAFSELSFDSLKPLKTVVDATYNSHVLVSSSFETSTMKNDVNSVAYTVYGGAGRSTVKKHSGNASCYFPGTSGSRIQLNGTNLNFGTNDFTIEFWACPETQTTSYPVCCGIASHITVMIYDQETKKGVSLSGNNYTRMISSDTYCKPNTWTNYKLVRKNGVFMLYEDDLWIGSNTSYTTMSVNLTDLRIGGLNGGEGVTEYKGYIDDFKVYNMAIQKSTVTQYKPSDRSVSVNVNESSEPIQININDATQYNINYNKTFSTETLTWSSFDEDIATVSDTGVITGKASGSTSILVTDTVSGGTTTIEVNVLEQGSKVLPKVVGGWNHFAALKSDGTVWVWGKNDCGQLGTGDLVNVAKPQKVTSVTDAIDVACIHAGTFILKSDGTVWGTGYNGYYELVNGSTTNSTTFKKINGLSSIIEISGCYGNCYALKSDGTVWSWGYNANGQIGDGTTNTRTSVYQMPKVTNIVQISAGHDSLMMLDGDGSVWGVGYNGSGQFGNEISSVTYKSPTKLAIRVGRVKELAAGEYHTVFLMSDGTVYTAGYNSKRTIRNRKYKYFYCCTIK